MDLVDAAKDLKDAWGWISKVKELTECAEAWKKGQEKCGKILALLQLLGPEIDLGPAEFIEAGCEAYQSGVGIGCVAHVFGNPKEIIKDMVEDYLLDHMCDQPWQCPSSGSGSLYDGLAALSPVVLIDVKRKINEMGLNL